MTLSTAVARVHGLDTLRALAIMLVYAYHYMIFVSREPTFGIWSDIGWVGVDLFFALSGYLIGNQIFAALRADSFSLKHFYARRFLRTLPNFYVVLALFYLVPAVRGDAPLLPLWKFLTFTQNYQLQPGTAFSHAWSLCIEEQFYVLLPALALLIAALRRPLAWGWLAIGATFVAGMLIRASIWDQYLAGRPEGQVEYYRLVYYSTFCRFDELVAGVALALMRNYHPALWGRLTGHGNAMLVAGMLATGITFYCLLQDRYGFAMTVFGYPMLALSCALLLISALSEGSILNQTRVPGALQLAAWSYAIYLTHKPVCAMLNQALLKQGLRPDAPVAIVLMIVASVAVGWLLYKLVETPFLGLRQRFVPSPATA